MDKCVDIAKESGLGNAYWSGTTGIPGTVIRTQSEIEDKYVSEGARLGGSYALHAGCQTHPRRCSTCTSNQACGIKKYIPRTMT